MTDFPAPLTVPGQPRAVTPTPVPPPVPSPTPTPVPLTPPPAGKWSVTVTETQKGEGGIQHEALAITVSSGGNLIYAGDLVGPPVSG